MLALLVHTYVYCVNIKPLLSMPLTPTVSRDLQTCVAGLETGAKLRVTANQKDHRHRRRHHHHFRITNSTLCLLWACRCQHSGHHRRRRHRRRHHCCFYRTALMMRVQECKCARMCTRAAHAHALMYEITAKAMSACSLWISVSVRANVRRYRCEHVNAIICPRCNNHSQSCATYRTCQRGNINHIRTPGLPESSSNNS